MRMAHRGVEKAIALTSKVVMQMIEERIQRLREVGKQECCQKSCWMTMLLEKVWKTQIYQVYNECTGKMVTHVTKYSMWL